MSKKTISNSKERIATFILFMMQQKETTSMKAAKFICDTFGMESPNAFRFLRQCQTANIIRHTRTIAGKRILTFCMKLLREKY